MLLALSTFVLARRSRQQATAALQEVELSRRALEANARPLLVDAPRGVFWEASDGGQRDRGQIRISAGAYSARNQPVGSIHCEVPLQNVGVGLALIERFQLQGLARGITWRQVASQSVVPPGQLVSLAFEAEVDPGDAEAWGFDLNHEDFELDLDVWYSDISGEQRARTRVLIEGHRGWWRPTHVALYEGDQVEPFTELRREIVAISTEDA